MVLQRGALVPIWGWADEGEAVTVQFGDQTVHATAKDGRWIAQLKKLKAGDPRVLKVTGKNSIILTNVVVGEVWVASGQSNMEWPMKLTFLADIECAAASNPMIRLFTVPRLRAEKPTNNVPGNWTECTPSTITNFSAVAYYFARDLQKALKVPVGVVHTSWGGSPAEVWMREEVLLADPEYKRDIVDAYPMAKKNYESALANFKKAQAQAKSEGKEFTNLAPWMVWRPTELYNGMIAPIIPFAIKGAIWYQGESNAGRAHQYRRLFVDMIRNWRHDWGQGDFPFLEVQLAPFMAITNRPMESTWAELREAQVFATQKLPKVGLAVITDVGEELDIHPRKKEPVGGRLALAARSIAYGQRLVYSGPSYKSMRVKGDQAILSFDHVGSGLVARDGELKGFAIAGEDRKFVWAAAHIEGDKVIVHSLDVQKPVAVRYGWANFPVVNLWNKDGLPASPFRTDNFPMITEGKK
jgi:sialate O-acetylesterase